MAAWSCPRCKKPCPARKKLEPWRLPEDLLLIQLKRFRQSAVSGSSTKLSNRIDFPLRGLDMSSFVYGENSWGKPRGESRPPVFDLAAVVNHVGLLSEGHYFAYAKHEATGQWYEFNDASCTLKNEADVVTSDAYLLVYQRRPAAAASSMGGTFADK